MVLGEAGVASSAMWEAMCEVFRGSARTSVQRSIDSDMWVFCRKLCWRVLRVFHLHNRECECECVVRYLADHRPLEWRLIRPSFPSFCSCCECTIAPKGQQSTPAGAQLISEWLLRWFVSACNENEQRRTAIESFDNLTQLLAYTRVPHPRQQAWRTNWKIMMTNSPSCVPKWRKALHNSPSCAELRKHRYRTINREPEVHCADACFVQKISYLNTRISRAKQVLRSFKVELREVDKVAAEPFQRVCGVSMLGSVALILFNCRKWNRIRMPLTNLSKISTGPVIMKHLWVVLLRVVCARTHLHRQFVGSPSLNSHSPCVRFYAEPTDVDKMNSDQVLKKAADTQLDSMKSLDRTLATIETTKKVRPQPRTHTYSHHTTHTLTHKSRSGRIKAFRWSRSSIREEETPQRWFALKRFVAGWRRNDAKAVWAVRTIEQNAGVNEWDGCFAESRKSTRKNGELCDDRPVPPATHIHITYATVP